MHTALLLLLILICPLGMAPMGGWAWAASKLGRGERRG